MTGVLLAFSLLASSSHAADPRVGGHSSPFFFAEEEGEDLKRAPEPETPKEAAPAPAPGTVPLDLRRLKEFKEGGYRGTVEGMICNACAMAVVAELKRIKGIADASLDFEEGVLRFSVAKGKRVRVSKVLRAVRHAGRRVNLGAKLYLESAYEDK